jgi:hypothetical protein
MFEITKGYLRCSDNFSKSATADLLTLIAIIELSASNSIIQGMPGIMAWWKTPANSWKMMSRHEDSFTVGG